MVYYKVKISADNVRKNVQKTDFLVKNELYTEAELKKITVVPSLYTVKYMDKIEVNKNTTYFFFGARFCTQFPYTHY